MGKNQAYKAMQRSRVGSSAGGPEEVEDGMVRTFSYHFSYQAIHFLYGQLLNGSCTENLESLA